MSAKKEDVMFLYEKAIAGREHLQQNFNHWMNMYALFNGALFIGYYTLLSSNVPEAKLGRTLILALGCLEALFWHCSARGFYRWILSWIGVVQYYEKQLSDILKAQTSENSQQQNLNLTTYSIYSLFVHLGKKGNKKPFSTQKITILFTLAVTVAWGLLFLRSLFQLEIFSPALKNALAERTVLFVLQLLS